MSTPVATETVVVLTTVGSAAEAATLARTLVDERLAACVNVLPEMASWYRWEGAVNEGQERLLVIKTTRRLLETLQTRVHALHPYDLPEFLVLPVTGGSRGYLNWIVESCRAPESTG